MLHVTDEPEVTTDTRFWLFSEVRARTTTVHPKLIVGPSRTFRIRYEVNEAAYRAAQAEAHGDHGDDFTTPLDDHWWNDREIARFLGPYGYTTVRLVRGGLIDWWA